MTNDSTPSIRHRTKRLFLYLIGALLLLGISTCVYMDNEANNLTFAEETAPQNTLPSVCSGLRILTFSDVHSNITTLSALADKAQDLQPDMIVFLGDLFIDYNRINHRKDIILQLRRLSNVAPTFACLGNHDYSFKGSVADVLQEGGFTLLENKATLINLPKLGDNPLKIVGLSDWRESLIHPEICMTRIGQTDEKTPTIVLAHNPLTRRDLDGYQCDLMLSGHTHGGQMNLPFIGGSLLLKDGETLSPGFHQTDHFTLFISQGIGYLGPGRLNCPPRAELLIIP